MKRLALLFLIVGASVQSSVGLDLIGYDPYYRINTSDTSNTLQTQLGMLNEVRYFGLTAGSDGSIVPLANSGTLQSHKDKIAFIKQKIGTSSTRLDITLGGAGESANFATIAASATLRSTFAQNIKTFLDQNGATSVDIDWESPNNSDATQLNNYALMLQQIKHAVGGSDRVYTAIEPQIKLPKTVFEGADAITGISLMTYDLSWWANDSTDPNRGEHSLPEYVADTVSAWTDPYPTPNRRGYVFPQWGLTSTDASDIQQGKLDYGTKDLGVGLPFYGRVIGTSAHPQGGADYTYQQLVTGGTADASGNYYTYAGQTVWLPGPSLAAQRVQFANDKGLQNLFIWEIGQDVDPASPNSLLRAAFLKNETLHGDFDGDRDVDAADFAIWRSTFGSTTDLRADGNGNGVIDAGDYVTWRVRAATSAGGVSLNAQVPEPPTTSPLVLIGLVLVAIRRRGQLPRRSPGFPT